MKLLLKGPGTVSLAFGCPDSEGDMRVGVTTSGGESYLYLDESSQNALKQWLTQQEGASWEIVDD